MNLRALINKNVQLPLDHRVTNQVLIILAAISLLTGTANFFAPLPLWYPLVYYAVFFVSMGLLYLNLSLNLYSITKPLYFIVIYAVALVSWPYNSGVSGSAILFFFALQIYSIGIYKRNFLLLFIINYLLFSSLTIINYLYPNTVLYKYPSEIDHVADMVISYFLIGLSVYLVLRTTLNSYQRANAITEEQNRQLEKLNHELNFKAFQLNELNQTKDKLFSIIAHDLKNPFASILYSSEVLKEDIEKMTPEEISAAAGRIEISAQKNYKLLENLLFWAQSQTGAIRFEPKTLTVKTILTEIVGLLEPTAKIKNIQISYFTEKLDKIIADENMLYTILRNLITNAIKYTQNNGKIDIFATMEGTMVKFSVRDSGIGITEKSLAQLFSISNITSRPGTNNETGTGLGLVLCKEFVEKHRGKIWAESVAGKGSTFHFTLPAETI